MTDAVRLDRADAIAAFWSWWAAHRDGLASWVGTRDVVQDDIDAITAHVHAIHPELTWEFGAGRVARHGFALSAAGDASLRVLAETWRAAGPGDDPDFEFHCSKQAMPPEALAQVKLGLGPHELAFADVAFATEVDEARNRVHVTLHHPIFGQVPEEVRGRVMFIVLDNVLGEDTVASWLGALETSGDAAPDGAADGPTLQRMLAAIGEQWSTTAWRMYQGLDEHQQRHLLALDAGARRWRHPLHDTVATLTLTYAPGEEGLPAPDDHAAMGEWEDALLRDLDAALHVATETGAGERVLTLVLRGEDGPARRTLEDAVAAYGDRARLAVRYDPSWDHVPSV
jgi:hypothetical protein